jgi:hypothetical protein
VTWGHELYGHFALVPVSESVLFTIADTFGDFLRTSRYLSGNSGDFPHGGDILIKHQETRIGVAAWLLYRLCGPANGCRTGKNATLC